MTLKLAKKPKNIEKKELKFTIQQKQGKAKLPVKTAGI